MKSAMRLLVAFAIASASGCATILSGSTQELSFQTSPEGATVTVDNRPIGTTPLVIQLEKKPGQRVSFSKKGYRPVTMEMDTTLDPWFWANILTGVLPGSTTDNVSGAVHKYAPGQYHVTLEPEGASRADAPPITAPSANTSGPEMPAIAAPSVNAPGPEIPAIAAPHAGLSRLEAPVLRVRLEKIKHFIIVRHQPIVHDAHNGGGENSTALLQLLNVPEERHGDAIGTIRSLSDSYPYAPQFADQVIGTLYVMK